jgi:hypothetical protein
MDRYLVVSNSGSSVFGASQRLPSSTRSERRQGPSQILLGRIGIPVDNIGTGAFRSCNASITA